MASLLAFSYIPSTSAVLFTIDGVQCAIDITSQTPTEVKFGVLERFPDGKAQWMGPNANTSGGPCWTMETPLSPLGDFSTIVIPGTTKQASGTMLQIINALGAEMLSGYKDIINGKLAARFPAGGTPVVQSPGNFTDESTALAWLMSQLQPTFVIVNGRVQ